MRQFEEISEEESERRAMVYQRLKEEAIEEMQRSSGEKQLTVNDLRHGAFYLLDGRPYRAEKGQHDNSYVHLYDSAGKSAYVVEPSGEIHVPYDEESTGRTAADLREVPPEEVVCQLLVAGQPFTIDAVGTKGVEKLAARLLQEVVTFIQHNEEEESKPF